jgi:MFS family permease
VGSASLQQSSNLAVTDAHGGGSGKGRIVGRLAWLLWAICLALAGLAIVFAVKRGRPLGEPVADILPAVTWTIAFSLVGAVVASRRPRHRLGWIFCIVGLSQGLVTFTNEYAVYALWTAPGSLPGGPFMAWLTTWDWAGSAPVLLTFVPLLFPDGRLPSRRWRPVAWLSAVPIALLCGPIAILYWPLRGPALVEPGDFSQPTPGALAVLYSMVGGLMVLCGLACALALLLRFRRAHGVERQQLKWFVFAAAVTLIAWWGLDQLGAHGVQLGLAGVLLVPVAAAIPVAAGIAIVRYRLYDIDRLINRTLVYSLLTALLAVVYAGLVLVLGQLFGGIGAQPPSWAVAGATLAVAALFQPARRRIQGLVDRRFNRRKYDAAKTVEAFSARLRDEVDLDALWAELLAVADQTMQPTTASLWLRSAAQAWPHGR